ncbi:hypothetical protein GCM10027287_25520 [Bordetella muralis]
MLEDAAHSAHDMLDNAKASAYDMLGNAKSSAYDTLVQAKDSTYGALVSATQSAYHGLAKAKEYLWSSSEATSPAESREPRETSTPKIEKNVDETAVQHSGTDAVVSVNNVQEVDDKTSQSHAEPGNPSGPTGSGEQNAGEPNSDNQDTSILNSANRTNVTPDTVNQNPATPDERDRDTETPEPEQKGDLNTETPDAEQVQSIGEVQAPVAILKAQPSVGNTAIRPAAGSYMSNAWAANTMFQMNLNDRLGSYYQGETSPHQGSAWIRYSGSRGHLKDTTGELRTAGDKSTVMMGVDMLVQSTNARDQFTIGIMGGYGHYSGHTQANGFDYSTKGKVNGYSVGLYGTYQKDVATQHGFYADSSLLWNQFDNRVKGGDLPAEKYDAKGMTASLELGYNIPLADRNNVKYVLQPHAQVMYQNVRSENFRQVDGTNVDFMNGSHVQTALGVRAAAHITTGLTSVITPHIEANWLHANKGYGVKMDNVDAAMNSGRNIGQVKLGVQGDMNRHVSLNVELFHNQGNAGYHETGGNVTAKYRF